MIKSYRNEHRWALQQQNQKKYLKKMADFKLCVKYNDMANQLGFFQVEILVHSFLHLCTFFSPSSRQLLYGISSKL